MIYIIWQSFPKLKTLPRSILDKLYLVKTSNLFAINFSLVMLLEGIIKLSKVVGKMRAIWCSVFLSMHPSFVSHFLVFLSFTFSALKCSLASFHWLGIRSLTFILPFSFFLELSFSKKWLKTNIWLPFLVPGRHLKHLKCFNSKKGIIICPIIYSLHTWDEMDFFFK